MYTFSALLSTTEYGGNDGLSLMECGTQLGSEGSL